MINIDETLEYHSRRRPGKIEVSPSKPCITQKDLSLAYTPGVAAPCRAIQKNAEDVFKYTAKGNLVAVISNGTAVLGLGNIGAAAGKPVMEGKGVLFKRFADIDVFDIEINTLDPAEVVKVVKALEPTFGGINLEDIKAPDCFYIEEELRRQMDIPVFHDDQHGTAIISGAALLNALELAGKRIDEVKVVFNGAGAAGIACAKFYVRLGVRPENLILCDSRGVIYAGREAGMNPYKQQFAIETNARTLAQAMRGADVFAGLSKGNVVSQGMVRSMARNPIIFAMANPDPEITFEAARAARSDVIMASGRSDYPNQINNVLGFPFIFRGALDVRARTINEEMKIAAAKALAALAKEPVPFSVVKAYRMQHLEFGRDYIIPKPFDPRVLIWEAAAVAEAAIETGVARVQIDLKRYPEALEARLGKSREIRRFLINKARKSPKRIVYPEGEHESILKACEFVLDEGLAHPILLGNAEVIRRKIKNLHLNLDDGVEIIDPVNSEKFVNYVDAFHALRHRKGVNRLQAKRMMAHSIYFGAMMVHQGDADGMVCGVSHTYPETIRPALQVIGVRPDVNKVAGLYIITVKDKVFFFADATVNIEPSAADLAEIAILCAKEVRRFDTEPRIAMLSFSNFGSTKHPLAEKVKEAVDLVKRRAHDLIIDGEMQADTAVVPEIIDEFYPFSTIRGWNGANVLIFPNLESGNIAYKLMQRLGNAETIGPILLGMRKPVHVLQISDFDEAAVVNMTAIAVVDAQAGQHAMDHPV